MNSTPQTYRRNGDEYPSENGDYQCQVWVL